MSFDRTLLLGELASVYNHSNCNGADMVTKLAVCYTFNLRVLFARLNIVRVRCPYAVILMNHLSLGEEALEIG